MSHVGSTICLTRGGCAIGTIKFLAPSRTTCIGEGVPGPTIYGTICFNKCSRTRQALFVTLPRCFSRRTIRRRVTIVGIAKHGVSRVDRHSILNDLVKLNVGQRVIKSVLIFRSGYLVFMEDRVTSCVLSGLRGVNEGNVGTSLYGVTRISVPRGGARRVSNAITKVELSDILSITLGASESGTTILVRDNTMDLG